MMRLPGWVVVDLYTPVGAARKQCPERAPKMLDRGRQIA
jgi:hypothetical protein